MAYFNSHVYKRLLGYVALFLLSIVLSGCDWWASFHGEQSDDSPSIVKTQQDESRRLLKRAIYTPSFEFHPHQQRDDLQLPLLQDLYEGLIRLDQHGKAQGAAAESWEHQEYKIWTFRLHDDLHWSNGERLTAQDFVQSWYALARQENNPFSHYLRFMALENVDQVLRKEYGVEMLGIEALDDNTLQLRLSRAIPYLPYMLSHIALMPLYQQAVDSAEVVTNGAYRLLYDHGSDLLLEKNPFYRDSQSVAFHDVSYHILSRDNLPALEEFDLVQLPSDVTYSSTQMQVLSLPQLCSYYYEFNFRHPLLKQSAVRKAINGMISVPEVLAGVEQYGRINSQFLPHSLQLSQREGRWTTPTLVEQLLAQSGVNSQKPLRLRFSYDDFGIHRLIAERMIRMLSQSDLIHIQAEALPRHQLLEKHANGDFDLIRSGWCADYPEPSAFLNIFHSQSANNKMAYQNPKLDELLQQTLQPENEERQREQRYTEIEHILNQEQVVLPLLQYDNRYLIRDNIAGYDPNQATIPSQKLYRKVTHTP